MELLIRLKQLKVELFFFELAVLGPFGLAEYILRVKVEKSYWGVPAGCLVLLEPALLLDPRLLWLLLSTSDLGFPGDV